MTRFMSRSLSAFALLAVLAGCDDTTTNSTTTATTVDQSFTDSKARGNIFVLLRDQVSGDPLEGARVTLLGSDSTTVLQSGASGDVVFRGLLPGTRLLRLEKDGYAGRLVTVTLADGASDVPRLQDLSFDVSLPKLGAEVNGKVYFLDKTGNRMPLKGALVDLYFRSEDGFRWIAGHRSTGTDSLGEYGFDSLPEDVEIELLVRSRAIDGNVYAASGTRSIDALKSGETRYIPVFELLPDVEAFALLSDNLDAITENDALSLTFSQAVDTTALRIGDIAVVNGTTDVGILASWSSGARTLQIRPFSGKWITGSNRLVLNLKSGLGVSLAKSMNFVASSVSELPKQSGFLSAKANVFGRDTNKVNSATASVEFKWGRAAGAEGYDLYKKARGDNAYLWVAKTSDAKDTVLALNTTDMFDKGDTVSFVVVPFNSKGSAGLASAPSLKLTDAIRPKLVEAPADFAPSSLDNSGIKENLVIGTAKFAFSEVMDTLARPEIVYENQNGTKIDRADLVIEWTWTSASEGALFLAVRPDKNASGLDAKISVGLSDFRDQNGNLFQAPAQADWTTILAKAVVVEAPPAP
jgi:hypothetical protein